MNDLQQELKLDQVRSSYKNYLRVYEKALGDHTVRVEVTPKAFQSSFSDLRAFALKEIRDNVFILKMNSDFYDAQVRFLTGLITAYFHAELITSSERYEFNRFLEYYGSSFLSADSSGHVSHVSAYLALRC